jgi:hypothetical protein
MKVVIEIDKFQYECLEEVYNCWNRMSNSKTIEEEYYQDMTDHMHTPNDVLYCILLELDKVFGTEVKEA